MNVATAVENLKAEIANGTITRQDLNDMSDCCDGLSREECEALAIVLGEIEELERGNGCRICSAPQPGVPHCPAHS